MSLDKVASLAAVVAAVAAIVAVWFQARYARFAMRFQLAWQLDRDFFYEEAMIERRRVAATALLEGRTAIEIDELLNFFDTVGLLVRQGVNRR